MRGGGQYFYRKDVQGNIIAILDNTGAVVVRYIYDAWGNHAVVDTNGEDVAEGIGVLNPFRYRGYYYDTETSLYYLQTRYYDPELGRFISQDSINYADPETINGLNLYAYCGDNPVMGYDPYGTINLAKSFINFINRVKTFSKKIGDLFGTAISYGQEISSSFNYYFVASFETGIGYSRSFDNGKPINFYLILPEKWYRLWELSAGIDINVNGYGVGLSLLFDSALTLHLGDHSIDLFVNFLSGRAGIRWATKDENDNYAFWKFSVNLLEIGVTIAAIYAISLIPELLAVAAA